MMEVNYLNYAEAVLLHLMMMRRESEDRAGAFDPNLIKSALARPQHAATYENADLIRQAATLCFGLIKSHPWVGGNKRTATLLVERFLFINQIEVITTKPETIELVLAVESNQWDVDQITEWYRQHTRIKGRN
ncbi:MAG: type II toxin-antitoxin system death-on-curing family toxin [Acidobacteria bacterium]|nr:type II toxin-antitoxin system death-on-curing family toxin [Acidobacteriota bacterium]